MWPLLEELEDGGWFDSWRLPRIKDSAKESGPVSLGRSGLGAGRRALRLWDGWLVVFVVEEDVLPGG